MNNVEPSSSIIEVSGGGAMDFFFSDEELALLNAEGEDEEDFSEVLARMSARGRGGDDTIGHLTSGEMVIPKAFLEENPHIKDTLFSLFHGYGIEFPERFIVGSDANIINPDTGAPEFFLGIIKKGIKAIGNAGKKVFKGVLKVAKIAAPIVLPIALTAVLGPVFGPALSAGILSLVNGNSLGDAVKSAAFAGVTGGIFAGVTGAGSFGENIKAATANPFKVNPSSAVSAIPSGASGGAGAVPQEPLGFFGNLKAAVTPGDGISLGQGLKGAFLPSVDNFSQPASPLYQQAGNTAGLSIPEKAAQELAQRQAAGIGVQQRLGQGAGGLAAQGAEQAPGFFESLKGAVTPGDDVGFGQGLKNAFFPAKDTNPSFLRKYAPLAGLGLGAAALAGGFKTPEQEPIGLIQQNQDGSPFSGEDVIDQDPGRYLVQELGPLNLNQQTSQYEKTYPGGYPNQYTPPPNPPLLPPQPPRNPYDPFNRPPQQYAMGGMVQPYPSMVGMNQGGMPPQMGYNFNFNQRYGTPGQDSVPAMLTPNEFVMTEQAVNGAGGGDTNRGVRNMYQLMHQLESRNQGMQ